jgi:hypothetical protein
MNEENSTHDAELLAPLSVLLRRLMANWGFDWGFDFTMAKRNEGVKNRDRHKRLQKKKLLPRDRQIRASIEKRDGLSPFPSVWSDSLRSSPRPSCMSVALIAMCRRV